MKSIRRMSIVVTILYYQFVISKMQNKNLLFFEQHQDKKSSSLQENVNINNSFDEFPQNRKLNVLNRRTRAVAGKHKNFIQAHDSLNTQTISNEAFYHIFKPFEMKKNQASQNEVKQNQCKHGLLPPKVLNEFHMALFVHPFKTWKLKNKFSSMEDIRVHENVLHNVIHNPRNERLKRKLYKVLQGEDVYLDVFGGSNSLGAGLKDHEERYSQVITEWWTKTITPITKSRIKIRQIAMGGTSSEFFQFCFGSYIHEQLDLVFIELAVNDVRELPLNANKCLPLEQFSRQLLAYPTEPALVYVNLFFGAYCRNCHNLEDYGQGMLSDTYNITSLKWRDAVCSKNAGNLITDPCDQLIASDGYHVNQLAHAHISLMVINLFRRILLDHLPSAITNSLVLHGNKHTCPSYDKFKTIAPVPHGNKSRPFSSIPTTRDISSKNICVPLPRPVFINETTKIILDPLCWTGLSPNYSCEDCINNTLQVFVTKIRNFKSGIKKMKGKYHKPSCRADGFSSWTGKIIGARITFSFTVPRVNRCNRRNITRSVAIATRTSGVGGAAHMWLDSDYKKRKFVNTKLNHGRTTVAILALHVAPGSHNVNVEVVRKGEVSIVALMVGPSDGPY